MKKIKDLRIAVVGLGYVGLPLAVEFAKKYKTIGYDLNKERVYRLSNGIDDTLELTSKEIKSVFTKRKNTKGLYISNNIKDIRKCNVYIITVPTPIYKNKKPNLTPLLNATISIGKILSKGDTVIYESTVYPGTTEEECVPLLEKNSNLVFNKEFYVGYSPERINPGDKKKTLTKIIKVTSGSNKKSSKFVKNLYNSIIKAGTFSASSIKVAEAAKIIENSQRDVNIAFTNELAKIFNLLEINSNDVFAAANTKWNFLPFKPGLVGGHCIGVDPYYLAHKAKLLGYSPEIILAGRRINDSMGKYIADQIIEILNSKKINVKSAEVLVLGITFKENCPDIRNSKVIDMVKYFSKSRIKFDIYDPWVDKNLVKKNFNLEVSNKLKSKKYDSVILAVSHKQFKYLNLKNITKKNSFVYDVKGFYGSKSDYSL